LDRRRVVSYIIFFILIIILLLLQVKTSLADDLYYSLLIFGGEPEGIMAALSAARNGVDTILIMERKEAGGLLTYAALNYLDINYDMNGKPLHTGLFKKWHRCVGGEMCFSIERAKDIFDKMINKEDNIRVINEGILTKVIKEGQRIKGVKIKSRGNEYTIYAERYIDATQDAKLSVMAQAPFFVGGEDIGIAESHMSSTLILHIGNVNWQDFIKDIKGNKFGPSFYKRNHAWGLVKIGQLYKPHDSMIKLRGLNIVHNNSEVYINSMLIFGVDPLDDDSLTNAYMRGKEEAKYVLDFFRKTLSGFEEAQLLEFPEELYVRESRHILTKYQLGVKDLLAGHIFEDTITFASYPLDYQASTPEYDGFVLFNPNVYSIPLRSIIPLNNNNLLLVGRSSGFSSLVAASARVIPVGMSCGEAAGVAAAISLEKGLLFTEISDNKELIELIQKRLQLKDEIDYYSNLKLNILDDEEILPYIEELLSWGLIIAGYNNDFRISEPISESNFAHMLIKGLKRRESPILYEWVPGSLETLSSENYLKRDKAAQLLLAACSQRVLNINESEYYPRAIEMQLIPDIISEKILDNRVLNRREAYIIIASFLRKNELSERLKSLRGETYE
jgi:hypothetical protein